MKQSGKTIQNANLQLFLDSATNALAEGQQQFFTPPNVATSLFRPLSAARRELIFDPHFGNGALALASGAKQCIGIDIDDRVTSELTPPEDTAWSVAHADLTHWYPLAAEVGFTAPFITLNPPFSLRWHADRLAPLKESSLADVADVIREYPDTIDSTLASFLIALDLLVAYGEGFMVCNASTARRYFGDPQDPASPGKHPALMKYLWLWLEIPGAIYENQHTTFDTAVLYFSRSHGNYADQDDRPLFIRATGNTSESIDSALMVPEVFSANHGSRLKNDYECRVQHTLDTFRAVTVEHHVRHHGKRPDWNIQLTADGRLHTYLTPFQKITRRLDSRLVGQLQALHGNTPISLCVTATSRTALRAAADCGVWTIHPDVQIAISQALDEFAAEGAPFYRPSETQALGWIDEHSSLKCIAPGIGNCQPGDMITLTSSIETTSWKGHKINLAGDKESLTFTGRELLVEMTDPAGCKHRFHVRRDDADADEERDPRTQQVKVRHWWFADLIQHFDVPIPKDITSLRPDDYARHLAHMDRIQDQVIAHLAASAA